MTTKIEVTSNNPQSWINAVWAGLEGYRDTIPEGVKENDIIWDDICTAMAWITEEVAPANQD